MRDTSKWEMDFSTYYNPGRDTIKLRIEPLGVVAEIFVESVALEIAKALGIRCKSEQRRSGTGGCRDGQ